MTQVYVLKNLCCPNCASKIEDKVKHLDGIQEANFTFATQKMTITGDVSDGEAWKLRIQQVCDSIEEGVQVDFFKRDPKAQEEEHHHHVHGGDLWVIALGSAFMAYELASVFLPSLTLPSMVETILYGIVYIILGAPVLYGAIKNIVKGNMLDENFLMGIATVGAIAIGALPEAVGVILFYRIGEYFEHRATERSRNSIMEAIDMRPQEVRVLTDDGQVQVVAPETVTVGTLIEVRPGDAIPLDGTVVEGQSRINTAPITGESVPISARLGDSLFSGTINESNRIVLRVDTTLQDSMVTRILDAVENAAASKPQIDRFITRFARVYTPVVVVLAALVAIVPSLITGDWNKWIYTALTFLVISCPCALVLSVPLAFFSGIGSASKQGILLKGGRVLEALAGIKAVALDKTGTITNGDFSVHEVETANGYDESQLLQVASTVEQVSTHPIAMSIVTAAEARNISMGPRSDVQEIPGEGLVGIVDAKRVLVGNYKLMTRYQVDVPTIHKERGTTMIYVAIDGTYSGAIHIGDTIRSDSARTIQGLTQKGLHMAMLTGDGDNSAHAVGDAVGMTDIRASLLPHEKLEAVQSLRATYGSTLFVGDGINDAPVLAGADVGGAMGQGADAAIEAADIVFMRPSLQAIDTSLTLAKRTVSIAWQNVIFAIAVKVLIMVLGLAGYASMWFAVFGDTGVAILCILNSIRLLYFQKA